MSESSRIGKGEPAMSKRPPSRSKAEGVEGGGGVSGGKSGRGRPPAPVGRCRRRREELREEEEKEEERRKKNGRTWPQMNAQVRVSTGESRKNNFMHWQPQFFLLLRLLQKRITREPSS